MQVQVIRTASADLSHGFDGVQAVTDGAQAKADGVQAASGGSASPASSAREGSRASVSLPASPSPHCLPDFDTAWQHRDDFQVRGAARKSATVPHCLLHLQAKAWLLGCS